jgi:hypothetical protein
MPIQHDWRSNVTGNVEVLLTPNMPAPKGKDIQETPNQHVNSYDMTTGRQFLVFSKN